MTSSKRHAIAADFVFDGANLHRDQAVLVDGARVAGIVPRGRVPAGTDVHTLPGGAWLAPGFIDVQVNGGGDVLFNNQPDAAAIATIVAAHRKSGTTSLLPTFITDTRDKMKIAIDAVRKASDHPGVLGIHLEGPFLSPEKPGVHRRDFIRQPDAEDFKLLTSLGRGVTLVTLAPEVQPKGFIAQLAKSGIRVSLGHSAATYEQTKDAIAQGLTGFTHLFNAMAPLSGRAPGPVGAALESPDVFFGVIVDGLHVHPAMLRIALSGRAHPMLVTDAMASVGGTRSSFELYGETIEVVNGRCTRKDGTLAGSAIDMATAIRNCVDLLQIPLERALSLASANPAAFLGRSDLGHITPGRRADLVALEPRKVQVLETWVAGMRSDAHARILR